MANYDIGARVGFDGMQDARNQLRLLNGDIKALGSALTAEIGKMDDAGKAANDYKKQHELLSTQVERYKEKIEVLNKSLGEQKNKQEEAKKALEAAKAEFGENSDEATKAENAYVKASASVNNLATQLNNTTIAMQSAQKQLSEIGNSAIDAGSKIQKAGENISSAGDKITKAGGAIAPVSLAATAGLTASAKAAIDFEGAFAGVEKTVDGTTGQLEGLRRGIIDMSKEIPSSTTEISAVAEAAGQLGIQTDNVLGFTKVMIDMGNSTNLSAESAATSLARFANITQMSQTDFDRLGSVIVSLGNNFATTESEIVDMALRLAGAGKQLGMTESDILALAASLSSVGIEAEAGGSAISKVIVNMQLAVEKGGESLNDFAAVAGMTAKEFKEAFKKDATGALNTFIKGLSDTEGSGKSAIKVLDDMGITEVRMRDALLRSANASGLLSGAIEMGNTAWKENNALTEEANKRYGTTASQIGIAKNRIIEAARSTGEQLLPTIASLAEKVGSAADKFASLDDNTKETIVQVVALTAVASPAISMLGKITSTVGSVTTGVGGMVKKFGEAYQSTSSLGGAITKFIGPQGLFLLGATAAVALGVAIHNKMREPIEEANESLKTLGGAMTDFHGELSSGQSRLSDYSSGFSHLTEEQDNARNSMAEIQTKINEILHKAIIDRKTLTEDDIQNLENYYQQMRELSERELELERVKTKSLVNESVRRAGQNAASLEAYKATSISQIATLAEQVEKEKGYIEQQHGYILTGYQNRLEIGELTKEEYNSLAAAEDKSYQERLATTQSYLGQAYEAYSAGYTNRLMQDEGFAASMAELQLATETSNAEHQAKLLAIEDDAQMEFGDKYIARWHAEKKHEEDMAAIWNKLTQSMSEEQQEQLSNMLVFAAETELNGGEISKETEDVVSAILDNWDDLPEESKDTMKNTLEPMFDRMEKDSPELLEKAYSIGDGIISNLREALGVHSPSKKTREALQYVMEGAELGLADREEPLLSKARGIAQSIISTISNAFKIKSPSRVMREMFGYVGEGMELGLEDERTSIVGTMESIGNEAMDAMKAALSAKITPNLELNAKAALASAQALDWTAHTLPAAATTNNTKNLTINQTNNWDGGTSRNVAATTRALNRSLGELI
ncbi:phage tail tape measure protein [Ruminococcaceae bacterium OttesenSCG-928-A16]|nr:phage tail tape measure protein [Ruminococcaceae bacterium OttesenSCG-928-A16]